MTVRPDHRGLANATQGIPTIRRSRATTHSGAHIRKDGDDDVRSGTRAPYDQAPDLARYRHSRIHRLEPAGNPPQSYVDNAVQANLLAAMVDDPAAVNQVYNVALNEKTTLKELFDMIRSLLGPRFPHVRGVRPIHRASRAGDVRTSQADIDKAKRFLGYQPAWRIRQGLERTIEWYAAMLAPPRSIDELLLEPRVRFHGS